MNILIIGGTKFIGLHVVQQLVAMQHQVTVFHRGQNSTNLPTSVNHILGDRHALLNYRSAFEQLAPDVVLDMIPYTQSDAQAVIETFKGIARRVVGISSQDVYRARDILWGREVGVLDPVPLSEDSPLRTQLYPYQDAPHPLEIPSDYEKILVEQIYRTASEPVGTILRLPMVYGPHDPMHRFYPYLSRMDKGRPAIILEAQIAHWQGSYSYVENVALAIALAITDDRAMHRIYNISEANALSQGDFIRSIGQAAGWNGTVLEVPQSALPEAWGLPFNVAQHWVTDSTRIRQELAYTERITREEAFTRTVTWQRSHPPELGSLDAPELLDEATEDQMFSAISMQLKS
jgi:nucleoside-diphosphate-sugar epimerase